jgi:hypothetical protein
MSTIRSIAALATATLLAVPSASIAVGPPADPGHKPAGTPTPPASPGTDHPTETSNHGAANPTADAADTPGPAAPAGAEAKAYGRRCRGESREHVEGEKGTAFSRCVTAMAKAASGEAKSARTACAGLSRKHPLGEHGSPYSRCVAAVGHLVDQPRKPAGA